jgi:hypothetical protein
LIQGGEAAGGRPKSHPTRPARRAEPTGIKRRVVVATTGMAERIEIGASAPIRVLWEEYRQTIPASSLDPMIEETTRDAFYAGAAAVLGLVVAAGTRAQREAALNAAHAELQQWAAGDGAS